MRSSLGPSCWGEPRDLLLNAGGIKKRAADGEELADVVAAEVLAAAELGDGGVVEVECPGDDDDFVLVFGRVNSVEEIGDARPSHQQTPR